MKRHRFNPKKELKITAKWADPNSPDKEKEQVLKNVAAMGVGKKPNDLDIKSLSVGKTQGTIIFTNPFIQNQKA